MILALILFLVTYVLLLVFPKFRAHIALASAALFIILKIMPLGNVFSSVDWNVILMILGTMGVVSLFIESGMPARLADILIDKMPNVKWAIISLSLFASIVSAFIDNVATVLIIAPVALTIAKRLKLNPIPSIIAISIASNLQGAATLVGDTTSILLGGAANMDFFDFFFYQGKLGIFFVVQLGALAATLVLVYIFRKDNQKIYLDMTTKVEDYVPSYLLIMVVLTLIIASFIPNKPQITNGLICMFYFVIGTLYTIIKTKSLKPFIKTFNEIDHFTIFLLIGLFIIIGSISEAGLIDAFGNFLADVSNGNLFLIYTIIVFASVLFSAFIDNIPYVATMLPVVTSISLYMNINPTLLYFGLLIGATLGGNLTPIGASANISAIGILRKEGYKVTTKDFMKLGVPYTFAAIITGYLLIWIIWA